MLCRTYVYKKIRGMLEESGRGTESIQKSLRRYGTDIHPVLLERLKSYDIDVFEEMSTISSVSTKSYRYYPTSQGMRGNYAMNYLMQSFFDCEEPAWGGNVVYLSASSKTRDSSFEVNESLSGSLQRTIRDLSDGSDRPVSLGRLAVHYLGSVVASNLLVNDFGDTPVFHGIYNFLIRHKAFPHDCFVHMPGRLITRDMTMVTKYYAARDDYRAYVRDTNALRHLAGLCLHRLILPQRMDHRRSLERDKVIPAMDKDILNLRIRRPRADQVALLILGDVSNFTGSLANGWIMLFCMAAQLAKWGRESKKPNLYSIRDAVFSATWYEVIMIYLYLTVGYPAYVDELDGYAYLPGGFLGVSANITVGLLYLALVLQNLVKLLQSTCIDVQAQAGGDDFSFGLVVHNDDKDAMVALIRDHFSKYVGNLKAFHVIDLAHIPEGVVGEYEFCKKRITLHSDHEYIYLKGQDNIPVPECLLPAGHVSEEQAWQVWSSFSTSLSIWERTNGCSQQTDTLRQLFLLTYPSLVPACQYSRRTICCSHQDLVRVGSMYLTKLAYDLCLRVKSVQLDDVTYLGEMDDKVQYCLKSSRLTCVRADWRGRVVLVVYHKCEKKLMVKEISQRMIGLSVDEEFLCGLLDLIYKA